MKYIILILMVIALAVFGACSSEQKTEAKAEAHGHAHEMKPVAIVVSSVAELSSAVDPVCNMTMTDEMLHSAVEYDGQKIGFCNAGCAAKFAENPEKFAHAEHDGDNHKGHDHDGHDHEGHNH